MKSCTLCPVDKCIVKNRFQCPWDKFKLDTRSPVTRLHVTNASLYGTVDNISHDAKKDKYVSIELFQLKLSIVGLRLYTLFGMITKPLQHWEVTKNNNNKKNCENVSSVKPQCMAVTRMHLLTKQVRLIMIIVVNHLCVYIKPSVHHNVWHTIHMQLIQKTPWQQQFEKWNHHVTMWNRFHRIITP